MRLFELRSKEDIPEFEPWYDKAFGFVVRANTEKEARELASTDCGI